MPKKKGNKYKSIGVKSVGNFASGVMSVRVGDVCDRFINQYADMCNRPISKKAPRSKALRVREIYNDQIALEAVVRKLSPELRIGCLRKKYCDIDFSPEGVIWAAKSRRKEDVRYVEAIQAVLGGR